MIIVTAFFLSACGKSSLEIFDIEEPIETSCNNIFCPDADNIRYNSYVLQGKITALFNSLPLEYEDVFHISRQSLGIELEDISLVILSHAGQDNIAGLKQMQKEYGVKIAINKKSAKQLAELGIKADLKLDFSDGDIDLRKYGLDLTAFEAPSWEENNIALSFRDGTILTGNLVNSGNHRIPMQMPEDVSELEVETLRESINTLVKHQPNLLLPFHGDPFDIVSLNHLVR
jgi:flavorubredoxin